MKTAELQKLDNQFIHPWEDVASRDPNKRTVLTGGEGIYVYDSDGNPLIDGPAGMWCVNIGYGRKEMADAISEQIMKITYASPWDMATSPAGVLANRLANLAPEGFNKVFFTTGGSTAVDSAMRMVIFRNNVRQLPEKKLFISRNKAYHGSTYLSASACGKSRDKNYHDFHPNIHFLSDPNPESREQGQSIGEYCQAVVDELEDKIIALGADKVAAFIAEPILASGGVVVPPEGYHKKCQEVCHKHDVLYISDEVVTGFGRLGHFFATKAVFDIDADIIITAKGLTSGYLPLGAFLVSDRIINGFSQDAEKAIFANGFTYSGHPVSCVSALKNIEIMEREKILEHVREVGPYFQERIRTLADIPIVTDIRGMGLMGCIECQIKPDGSADLEADYDIGERIDAHCQKLGLIVRPTINMCVFSPPLIISKAQIDKMINILREGLMRTMADLEHEGLLG